MNISVSVVIERSKADVWSAITDIENAHVMVSEILSLEVLEKPDEGIVGLKWKETRKMFGKAASETMWITDAYEDDYYCTRAESHGSVYLTKMSITKIETNKSELTMSFAAEAQSRMVKIVSAVMGVFVSKSMKKMLLKDLEDIKKYIEAQT